jgi:hypothetical protein
MRDRFPFLITRTILSQMIPVPKPNRFWDYAFFAFVMTGLLMFLLWPGASDAVGWTEPALALAAAVLFVPAVVLARRAERAAWIARPPDPTKVIPFGSGMTGHYTGHPVGLVVVVGVLLMGLWALPEARWFLGSAVLLGGIWGFFLWLRHR